MKTLVIIDIQNDFTTGGTLEVPGGELIIPVVNHLQPYFELVVATQDWHPENHVSFASNHQGKKPFDKIQLRGALQVLWPSHCIQGTRGAEFHPKLNTKPIEAIFRKGMHWDIDSYSGFYDNRHLKKTGLSGYLHDKGAKELYFCGLAADYCVYYSIKDALNEGFNCFLIEDATQPLDKKHFLEIKKELQSHHVQCVHSKKL